MTGRNRGLAAFCECYRTGVFDADSVQVITEYAPVLWREIFQRIDMTKDLGFAAQVRFAAEGHLTTDLIDDAFANGYANVNALKHRMARERDEAEA